MLRSPRIDNVFFWVADLDRTERFYADVVGLTVERQQPTDEGEGSEGAWLIARIPGNLDLLFFEGEVRPGNSPILVFTLDDGGIDGVVDGLAAAGATIVTPVSHAPGGWSADFADPDGYVLSLYQTNSLPR
ncbi:MAG TPA: VOC family protein [Gemmatimonadaceae bacterium]|nr:VOC family protein [Gemmatimonadaceae bacterium]